MDVSEKVKGQYHNNSIHKNLILRFPELNIDITNGEIHQESMSLKESILEDSNVEFVGCIASVFRIQINGVSANLKNQRIEVSIHTDDTEDEPVPLFHGIVDSVVLQSNRQSKELIAYDQLYTKGNLDVSAWYNGLTFPVTIKELRDSLFKFLGIEQEEQKLPNDDVIIKKEYEPATLKALNVIKAICQINGAFGIISRQNKFSYRILSNLMDTYAYPSTLLFPSQGLFPFNPQAVESRAARIAQEMKTESFGFYKNVNYEEYEVKPVNRLTIRQSENDAGVSCGSGENNYIIQGNIFAYRKSPEELRDIAKRIYTNVRGICYHPFESDNNGLPFIECGLDAVSYFMRDFSGGTQTFSVTTESSSMRNFYVFSRELTGIQALRDKYSAKGEEYQTEYVTDLQTQIDTVKQNIREEVKNELDNHDFTEKFEDYTYDKDYIDGMAKNQIKVESVVELPLNPAPNTIYLIQGEVTVT